MRLLAVVALVFLAACEPAPLPSAAPAEGDWVSLFNGRDLEGWTPKFAGSPLGENVLNTFRVEDGLLTASYDEYETWGERYGHLFYTVRPYSHYWLRVEYRFVGDQVAGGPGWAWRNNGIMIHSQPPETMALDQDFPVSIETRLLGGQWLHRRPTGQVCSPYASVLLDGVRSTEQCREVSAAPNYMGDQWVLMEVEVLGSERVRHYANGRLVLEYADLMSDQPHPWLAGLELGSGYIAIQAETHPTQFRRIELLNLAE
jgi:hypothetical protein